MDSLIHGKPYEQMDDLGVPLFLETPRKIPCHPENSSAEPLDTANPLSSCIARPCGLKNHGRL